MVTLEAEEVYALAPYAKTLGVEFEEMTAAGVQARPAHDLSLSTVGGGLHGGALTGLADVLRGHRVGGAGPDLVRLSERAFGVRIQSGPGRLRRPCTRPCRPRPGRGPGRCPGTPGSRTGSDQGPAGSVAVKSMFEPVTGLTLVTIGQKRPSWWRRVGA